MIRRNFRCGSKERETKKKEEENANMNGNNNNSSSTGTGAGTGSGNTVKLRASCNACNESKVRCSQTKPTCFRCERNGFLCVYGLSRRSHKDAPRIATGSRPPSSGSSPGTQSAYVRQSNRINAAGSDMMKQFHAQKNTPLSTPNSLQMPPDFSFFPQQGAAAFNFNQHMSSDSELIAGFQHANNGIGLGAMFSLGSLDAVGSGAISDSNTNPSVSSSGNREEGGAWISLEGSPDAVQSSMMKMQHGQSSSDGDAEDDEQQQRASKQQLQCQKHMPEKQLTHREGDCSCNSEAIPNLVRSSHLSRQTSKRLPFDVGLSQLKRAITACEATIACRSHSSDANVTMIIGVLIGSIVDGFETQLASESRPSSSPTTASGTDAAVAGVSSGLLAPISESDSNGSISISSNTSTESDEVMIDVIVPESRLSWGVLQLEDDDEVEIRNRLCMLYFRRLETLLKHFNQSVRVLRDLKGGQTGFCDSAYVMACEYLRMWLEQKAEAVKESLSRLMAIHD